MTFAGHVLNGVVLFETPGVVPDGTKVTIRVEDAAAGEAASATALLGQRFAWLTGAIPDLPADFAAEHDHYIHGTPRRSPGAAE